MAKRKIATAETIDTTATESGADAILRSNFSTPEQDSLSLMQAATLLIEADSPAKVNLALDHNLKLWVAIKTVVQSEGVALPQEVRDNLTHLAQYVSATTMEAGTGEIEAAKLIALARINMHIAEGLLRGEQTRMIQERAYELWEKDGRPAGREMDHWLAAEAEIKAMLHFR
ncbi:DUF2934 domain-containing protein [Azospirillum halopraeferens]|uniref:DUF2934 domain-containing protein n=1 Tax=Azospirillum halopraeferens TaxID=34010 RepID=UPI0003FCC13E|nr:DUF2934 domain-containing protein [Azospirillum halopraeferens]